MHAYTTNTKKQIIKKYIQEENWDADSFTAL